MAKTESRRWRGLGAISLLVLLLLVVGASEFTAEDLVGVAIPSALAEPADASRCDTCGRALVRNAKICLNSSPAPETCVGQASGGYYNCARKIPGGCSGTPGRQVYECLEGCKDLACVKACLGQ